MITPQQWTTWGAAFAIDLLWLVIAALSSSTFLMLGAALYTLALVAFAAADVRSVPED